MSVTTLEPSPPAPAAVQARMSAITAIVNSGIAAKVWCALFLATLVAAVTGPYLTIMAMKTDDRVIVLDRATDTEIYSSMNGFMSEGQLAAFHANLAVKAALLRNPTGLDDPELLKRLFLKGARAVVMQDVTQSQQEFTVKQIQQKTDTISMKVAQGPKVDGHPTMTVYASGVVTRTGVVQGVLFREPHPFRAVIQLVRNPDMLTNAQLPMVVYSWNYQEDPQ